jgi:hypothetical protein
MPRKTEWTVRVVQALLHRDSLPSLWVEQLRYAGVAKQIGGERDQLVFELYPPGRGRRRQGVGRAERRAHAELRHQRRRRTAVGGAMTGVLVVLVLGLGLTLGLAAVAGLRRVWGDRW